MSDSFLLVQFKTPPALLAAVKLAADRELLTLSEYVRRSLLHSVREDGFDPAKLTKGSADA
jgi:hypothetical protein